MVQVVRFRHVGALGTVKQFKLKPQLSSQLHLWQQNHMAEGIPTRMLPSHLWDHSRVAGSVIKLAQRDVKGAGET